MCVCVCVRVLGGSRGRLGVRGDRGVEGER